MQDILLQDLRICNKAASIKRIDKYKRRKELKKSY